MSNNLPGIAEKVLEFGLHEHGASTHLKRIMMAHLHIAFLFLPSVILINAQLLATYSMLSCDSIFSQTGRSLHIRSEAHISVCLCVCVHHMFLYICEENVHLVVYKLSFLVSLKVQMSKNLLGLILLKVNSCNMGCRDMNLERLSQCYMLKYTNQKLHIRCYV